MNKPNQTSEGSTKEIERIMGTVISACYDLEQTKPGVIKVVDKAMADFQALVKTEVAKARIAEARYVDNYWDGEYFHADEWQKRVEYLKVGKQRLNERKTK